MYDNSQIRVSVAMAVYNSEKYIIPQIDSIIKQLSKNDELVISYNDSTDRTWDIITKYASQNSQIKIYKCQDKGLVPNFNSAIIHTRGEYIFLSDHDDVWKDDKVNTVLKAFEKEKCIMVLHGRYVTDGDLNVIETVTYDNLKIDFFHNFISNKFCGSCMAFDRKMMRFIYPIPSKYVYHDAWIGLLCSLYGKISIINKPLMLYRRHGGNLSVSSRRCIYAILRERFFTLIEVIKRCVKITLIE